MSGRPLAVVIDDGVVFQPGVVVGVDGGADGGVDGDVLVLELSSTLPVGARVRVFPLLAESGLFELTGEVTSATWVGAVTRIEARVPSLSAETRALVDG